ncbi:TrkH family potassium uptake protein [Congregibacter litoralis]|uniref:Trk-type K+ transport system, membrane component n=1 Tax=Congregibacter litoralis KT71 TaxID=314285 RepID=A4A4V4_9GAMM|nr:potassium transporter TrkG [Congregibacter litoralis]EAQ98825.1 Trk-type K+ transport system, membrane component [Congregibacter litoralis KT71]
MSGKAPKHSSGAKAPVMGLGRLLSGMLRRIPPVWSIVIGYAAYMVVLFAFLSLPTAQSTYPATGLDHAFVAVSAVSTTGLSTVDVGNTYSFWGELAILLAIQAGGLGYMTLGSFVLLTMGNGLSANRIRIGRLAFHLPPTFALRLFLIRVVAYTVLIELIGAIILWTQFSEVTGTFDRAWAAAFHSISAFCTAGFSIFPNSLEQYRSNYVVNAVVICLSLAGALGFILFNDVWSKIKDWSNHHFSLTSKVILMSTLISILLATMVLYVFENALFNLPAEEHLAVALFQATSALTTVGFDTYPVSRFAHSGLFLLMLLMTLGASPAGTGGGLKSTTWMTGIGTLTTALSHRRPGQVFAFGREIPTRRVIAAFAAITLYVLFLFVGTFTLLSVEPSIAIADLSFEAASALGTVGLSTGITADLGSAGRWTIMILMFIGRVGPLTVALALSSMLPESDHEGQPEEDLAL